MSDIEQALAEARHYLACIRDEHEAGDDECLYPDKWDLELLATEPMQAIARQAAIGAAALDIEVLRRSEWDQSDDALTADELDRLESIYDTAIAAALGEDDE
jgi:hypothetical protein